MNKNTTTLVFLINAQVVFDRFHENIVHKGKIKQTLVAHGIRFVKGIL